MVISINTGKKLSNKDIEDIKKEVEESNKVAAEQSAVDSFMKLESDSMKGLECFFNSAYFNEHLSEDFCSCIFQSIKLSFSKEYEEGGSFIELVDNFLEISIGELGYLHDYLSADAASEVSIYTKELLDFLADFENDEYINQAFDAGIEVSCSTDLTSLASLAWSFKAEERIRDEADTLFDELQKSLREWRSALLAAIEEGNEDKALELVRGEYN